VLEVTSLLSQGVVVLSHHWGLALRNKVCLSIQSFVNGDQSLSSRNFSLDVLGSVLSIDLFASQILQFRIFLGQLDSSDRTRILSEVLKNDLNSEVFWDAVEDDSAIVVNFALGVLLGLELE
jgi:hypothetical protein